MSKVGPELPPHLQAKRKWESEEIDSKHLRRPSSPESGTKKTRIVGPAPPPAQLSERPVQPVDSSDSGSSEDEYGPAPPANTEDVDHEKSSFDDEEMKAPPLQKKIQRDEWMTMAPKQDDLSARMDPNKVRARKFNTGKGARAPNQGSEGSSIWMETPEEKRKRLEDEVLGKTEQASATPTAARERKVRKEDEDKAAKIREHDAKHRNKSLYAQHQASWQKEKDDDPSTRMFDYEKDMGGGRRIGHGEKKDMLSRASDFGSRFAGGSYL